MYRKPACRPVLRVLFSCLCFSALALLPCPAQGWSMGTIHSIKGVGLCADVFSDEDAFCSFTLTGDLLDIINGLSSTPGLKLTCHYNLVVRSWKDGKYQFYAGPGITGGRVRNLDNHFGAMGGVSGDAGLRVRCAHSIVVSAEFQADFALLFKNRFNPDMSLYRAGFRYSYYPHVRIQYAFGR